MPSKDMLKWKLNSALQDTEISVADVKYIPYHFYFKTHAREKHYEYLVYSNLGDDVGHINFKSRSCFC